MKPQSTLRSLRCAFDDGHRVRSGCRHGHTYWRPGTPAPVATEATGTSTIKVSADKSVTGSVKTTGVVGTMAHVHLAAKGQSGPPIITLEKTSASEWSISGRRETHRRAIRRLQGRKSLHQCSQRCAQGVAKYAHNWCPDIAWIGTRKAPETPPCGVFVSVSLTPYHQCSAAAQARGEDHEQNVYWQA